MKRYDLLRYKMNYPKCKITNGKIHNSFVTERCNVSYTTGDNSVRTAMERYSTEQVNSENMFNQYYIVVQTGILGNLGNIPE